MKAYDETNYANNTADTGITNFSVVVQPADTSIARLGTVQLATAVSGGTLTSWRWQPDPFLSCTNCLTPVVRPLYSKEYAFIARNEYACTDTAFAVVKTFTGGQINLPSAFSPNNDGLNDIFYILAGPGVSMVKDFTIFDRWGNKVFESGNLPPNDPRYGWDGKYKGAGAAPGTYVYQVRLPGINGQASVFKGTILLLR